jgi:hypothetical protein
MEDEEMEKKVQQYLQRKGFRLTELALQEERNRLSTSAVSDVALARLDGRFPLDSYLGFLISSAGVGFGCFSNSRPSFGASNLADLWNLFQLGLYFGCSKYKAAVLSLDCRFDYLAGFGMSYCCWVCRL